MQKVLLSYLGLFGLATKSLPDNSPTDAARSIAYAGPAASFASCDFEKDEAVRALGMIANGRAVPTAPLLAPRNISERPSAVLPNLSPDEELAIRRKVELGLPPSSVGNITLTRQGFAGARTVLMFGDMGTLFAKVFLQWPARKSAETWSRELLGATFAGNVGLAPRVLFGCANEDGGVLINPGVNNLFAGEGEGGQSPRLDLSLQLLDQLRILTIGHDTRHIDGQALYQRFTTLLNKLPPDKRADRNLVLVERLATAAARDCLEGFPYLPSVTHGDFTPGNVLVDTPERAYLVDWQTFAFGDPATDLARYLGFLAFRPEALDEHAHLMPHFEPSDLFRAQLYMVYDRSLDYLKKSLGGRPWDKPDQRENELNELYTSIQLDEKWLSKSSSGCRISA